MTHEATKRAQYSRTLAIEWVKQKRPDVWQVIVAEALTKYPVKEHFEPLPTKLDKLK